MGLKCQSSSFFPVYAALSSEMQSKIFDPPPPGTRKVVIATNLAETSITIDGIYYVVDSGFVKQNAFDPKLGMNSLVVIVGIHYFCLASRFKTIAFSPSFKLKRSNVLDVLDVLDAQVLENATVSTLKMLITMK